MKNGDLAAEHMRQALTFAGVFAGRGVDIDDLKDAAIEGLMKAAARFDVSRGVPFWAYARRHIAGKMLDLLQAHARRATRVAKWETVLWWDDDGKQEHLLEAITWPDEHLAALPLQRAFRALPVRLRTILLLRYVGGMSQRETSQAIGLAGKGARVSILERKALSQLRGQLESRGVRGLADIL